MRDLIDNLIDGSFDYIGDIDFKFFEYSEELIERLNKKGFEIEKRPHGEQIYLVSSYEPVNIAIDTLELGIHQLEDFVDQEEYNRILREFEKTEDFRESGEEALEDWLVTNEMIDSVDLNLKEFEKTLKYNNEYEFYYKVETL